MQIASRERRHWLAGAVFALLFFVLLFLRLGLFREDGAAPRRIADSAGAPAARDDWMSISQRARKIGYARRQFIPLKAGYRVREDVLLRINMMGVVQPLSFRVEGDLDGRMLLVSFTFDLHSGLFHFTARGRVQDKLLELTAGMPGEEQKLAIALTEPVHLAAGIFAYPAIAGLKAGETGTLHVFDPSAMAARPVRIARAAADEIILHQGRRVPARKYSLAFMGAEQLAWVGEDGAVLQEKGILGITLTRATRQEALQGIGRGESFDLAQLASIPVHREISDPGTRTSLSVRLADVGRAPFFLNGGRQAFRDGVLHIRKETLSPGPPPVARGAGGIFLRPSPLIQSDHPRIVSKAREITAGSVSDIEKAKKLVDWVYKNVKKQPVLSVPNALEVLANLKGDCNEHAVLLCALARAAGIPAEVEAGLVYLKGSFYYHAWNVLALGDWVTADATLGQLPADVTHLRFIRGSLEKQMDLLGLIGNVRLEVLPTFTPP